MPWYHHLRIASFICATTSLLAMSIQRNHMWHNHAAVHLRYCRLLCFLAYRYPRFATQGHFVSSYRNLLVPHSTGLYCCSRFVPHSSTTTAASLRGCNHCFATALSRDITTPSTPRPLPMSTVRSTSISLSLPLRYRSPRQSFFSVQPDTSIARPRNTRSRLHLHGAPRHTRCTSITQHVNDFHVSLGGLGNHTIIATHNLSPTSSSRCSIKNLLDDNSRALVAHLPRQHPSPHKSSLPRPARRLFPHRFDRLLPPARASITTLERVTTSDVFGYIRSPLN
jgi:hypothetical protein